MAKITVWKNGLEPKGLKVNTRKTKVIISGRDLYTFHTSGKYPCAVCRQGVGKNSIFCSGCSFLVHKKCSDIPGKVVEEPDFSCKRCLGNARAIDRRRCVELQLPHGKLDVVDNLSIMVTVFFQVEVVSLPLLKDATAWRKFRKLLPLLTCKAIALNTRGQIYNSCVRGTMLYSSECMALRQEDRKYLKRSEEFISKNSLLSQLKLKRLDSVLICNRLCWFGLVKQS